MSAPIPDRSVARALPPGSVIGIFGGGQLGRMLALSAARLGLKTHIFAPAGDAPATDVAAAVTRAPYEDLEAVAAFARAVDVVTLEFENTPRAALAAAAPHAPTRPGARALEVAQDRLTEKTFLREAGVGTVDFVPIAAEGEVRSALAAMGGAGLLKTRRFGYDGKGQARLKGAADIPEAWAEMAGAPAILEAFAPFVRELSVILARGLDGALRAFDPVENRHAEGVLRESRAPGGFSDETAGEAIRLAGRIAEALDYVGVLGVEFFELADGRLLVNEIAPRVHNTGHWTLEACAVSQFEQHIRAVAGWPLGASDRHSDATMTNLLGDAAADWAQLAAEPGAALHLYGKAEIRPGRKMGHVTRLAPRGTGAP